jgi:hypothetical protein
VGILSPLENFIKKQYKSIFSFVLYQTSLNLTNFLAKSSGIYDTKLVSLDLT